MAQRAHRRFSEAEKSQAFENRLTSFRYSIGRYCYSPPYRSPELQRRSSVAGLRDAGGEDTDVSDIDLSNSTSNDDTSVFSDTSDRASDIATRLLTHASESKEPPRAQTSQDQASASQCPSLPDSDSLQNPSLNLCDRCQGINVEALSSDLGYEHKLLSELPSHKQLCYLDDWDNKASIGVCKLCLVFMNAFAKEDLTHLDEHRHMLLIFLEGVEIHAQDHFDDYGWSEDRKVKVEGRSMSELILTIADVEVLEDYEPRFGDAASNFKFGLYRHFRRLHCFTDIDDPSVPFGVTPVRPTGESTSSDDSFDVAASWLSQCLAADPPQATNLHPERVHISEYKESACWINDGFQLEPSESSASNAAGPHRPRRLLEIGVGPNRDRVRLIEDNMDDVPYATLSYCWGNRTHTQPLEWLTTTENLHSRMAGLRRSELPDTLQDSITVAEGLGIQHIWIDSLCIVQDSKDDWAVEAARMGDIYRGSLVTIVAASSTSSESGCFNQRSVSTMKSLRAEHKLTSIQTYLSHGRACNLHIITFGPSESVLGHYRVIPPGSGQEIEDLYKMQVQKGPWMNRAWTLQEQILSRRLLFYTDKMLLWECDHCRLSEDLHPQMQGNRLYPLDMMGGSSPEGYFGFEVALTVDFWYCNLVEDYTTRQLTFSRDKLVAISALAQATSQRMRIKYFAGLWGNSIRYGLMWHRAGPGSKDTTSTCPSWSWASQWSPVSYQSLMKAGSTDGSYDPEVLDVHAEPSDRRNPFGDVKWGYVILQTKVQTGRILPDFLGRKTRSWRTDFERFNGRGLFIDSGTVMRYWPMFAYMDDEDLKHDRVLIAVVGQENWTHIALLLHPPFLGAEAYRRVGLTHMACEDEEVTSGFTDPLLGEVNRWATQTIKII